MNDLRARRVLIVGILYFLPEGRSLHWSCKKRVGTDFFAICSVLDLYNCSRLVSGVHNTATLHKIVYILYNVSLFLTERFPHQQTRPNGIIFFTYGSWKTKKMFLSICHFKKGSLTVIMFCYLCLYLYTMFPLLFRLISSRKFFMKTQHNHAS